MRLVKLFEYLDTNAALEERNALGAQGWECYAVSQFHFGSGEGRAGAVTTTTFHFKRVIGEIPARQDA